PFCGDVEACELRDGGDVAFDRSSKRRAGMSRRIRRSPRMSSCTITGPQRLLQCRREISKLADVHAFMPEPASHELELSRQCVRRNVWIGMRLLMSAIDAQHAFAAV